MEDENFLFNFSREPKNQLSIIPESNDKGFPPIQRSERRNSQKSYTTMPMESFEEEKIFATADKERKHRTELPKPGVFIKEMISQDNLNDSLQCGEEYKRPVILDESVEFYKGNVKYFDSLKEFGFLTAENEVKEIFFHYHDVCDERLSKEVLSLCKVGIVICVKFRIMNYMGKYQRSRKGVQVRIAD